MQPARKQYASLNYNRLIYHVISTHFYRVLTLVHIIVNFLKMCKRNYFRIFIYILFNSFYSSYFLMFSHFFVFYTFFIDDVGVKSNCTISSDFNIILRKRTTAKTENPVFLQWFFSCLNRFKSNARETWCVILVSACLVVTRITPLPPREP